MDWFKMGYTLLGGLGLFFYGISQFSESLSAMGSNVIKRAISKVTDNRVLAVITGLTITSIVQSSSVTTIMTVSFVNAGLMTLYQAIGVIFGANIGTTITGWIIAINIGKYGLALVGLGVFPMLFGKNVLWKTIGRCVFALGLVFFGLENMSLAFSPLRTNETFLSYLTVFSGNTVWSLIACIGMGCLLTIIVQSSSAMIGITIGMAAMGILEFQTAAGLVFGENIGTTIKALLASAGGTTAAKRAARAHTCFNVSGVILIIILFKSYIHFIDWLIPGDANYMLANGTKPLIGAHIAATHTVFNVTITLVFLPFLQYLARFVTWITPEPKQKEISKLKFIGDVKSMTPELAIAQVKQEILKMYQIVNKTIDLTKEYLISDSPDDKVAEEVYRHEKITDNIQKEITLFLHKVIEVSLSPGQTLMVNGLMRTSDELESVGDYCESLVDYKKRLYEIIEKFTPESMEMLSKYLDDVHAFYRESITAIDSSGFDLKKHRDWYGELGKEANRIREVYLRHIKEGKYNPLSGLTFSDIMVALRRVKNHSLNIAEALTKEIVLH